MFTLAACTDSPDQRLTATAPHPTPLIAASAGLVISDTNASPGSIITVTAFESEQDQSTATSFSSRIGFDTTKLTYLGPVDRGDGIRAVNGAHGVLRAAGAAVHGFRDRVLFEVKFRVNAAGAAQSLTVLPPRANVNPPTAANVIGDASDDGFIDASDAQLILFDAAGLVPSSSFSATKADANSDGTVTALDAQVLLSFIVGIDVSQFRIGDDVNATPITIASISPTTITPGATLTITGTNFAGLAADTVYLDSVAMPIVAASPTQLTVSAPAMLPCRPAYTAVLHVRSAGAGKGVHAVVRAGAPQTLQAGQSVILTTPASESCVEVDGSGEYVVTIFNASRSAASNTTVSFQVVGVPGSNAAISPSLSSSLAPSPSLATSFARATPSTRAAGARFAPLSPAQVRHLDKLRRRDVAHARFMRRQGNLLHQLLARGARPMRRGMRSRAIKPASAATASQSRLAPVMALYPPVSTTKGAVSDVKIPDTTYVGYTSIRARTAYVGQHCLILEDSASTLYGTIDASYAKLGAEFDQVIFPMLQTNFGNPLAMDANLDNNGRIIMLFSPLINERFPDVSGFVTSCDFFDDTDCPASNKAEMFYAVAPTSAEDSYDDGTVKNWLWTIRAIIPHEAKHITSFAEKLSRAGVNAYAEESWLEEGTAQVAAELYGRTIYGANKAAWKGDATYRNTLYCDLRPEWPECLDHPLIMLDHFSWLYDFGQNTEQQSVIDDAHDDGTVYGSAWLFARWLTDNYATNEASFLRALTQTTTTYGAWNVEARSGVSWPQLLAKWTLALAADDYGPSPSTFSAIPSWNVPDIFSGMSGDVTNQQGAPLFPGPWLSSFDPTRAPLADTKTLVGGAFSMYRFWMIDPNEVQTIGAQAGGGALLPTGTPIGMAIERIN